MSYAWLLPPLCDPLDGHLLMDGCYVNNVPGDIMADQNCKFILAVDVAAIEDKDLHNYGDTLSGWWVLWQRMNPFARPLKIPNQSDIQLRLAFCSHYKNLEELKSNSNYEYIKPPCDKYAAGDVIKQKLFIFQFFLLIVNLNFSGSCLTRSARSATTTATPSSPDSGRLNRPGNITTNITTNITSTTSQARTGAGSGWERRCRRPELLPRRGSRPGDTSSASGCATPAALAQAQAQRRAAARKIRSLRCCSGVQG